MSITISCHCGAVRIALVRAPETITECNCSLCRSYGVLWAYYEADDIVLPSEATLTHTYAWGGRNVDFHRCCNCGCVTHWVPRLATRSRRGVNARLLAPEILAAARVRHRDGAGSGRYLD